MSISRQLLPFLIPFVLVLGLEAQTTGTLTGTVNSTAGTPVPNAAVTVTPVSGGASQRVLTGPDGTFTISGLPSGSYRVDIEYSGYKRSSVQNLDLTTAPAASIRVELERGNTQETVEIKGTAVMVNDESAQTAHGIETRTITDLPLYDRNHQELVGLFPGVTPPQTSSSRLVDPQQNRYWEANGLSSASNNRMLDGVENTEPFTGRGVFITPVDASQQVNLLTGNFDAQHGRAGGSILDPSTRRGSNGLHGSLFEFNSNSAFGARNFFNPKGFSQASYNFNQTGISLGGPIQRDRTFFFLDYEGDFDRRQNPTVTTVPTADFRTGNFSAVPGLTLYNPGVSVNGRTVLPGNTIPAARISPIARSINSFIPLPNLTGFENNYLTNVPLRNDGHRADVRLDHKVGDVTNLFARWSFANYNTVEQSALGALGGGSGHLQNHFATIGGTHTLSPSVIADLRLNYTRYSDKLNSLNSISPAALGFTDPTLAGMPSINIGGMDTFGTPANLPQFNAENNFNLNNDWNILMGRNNIHAGFDVWWIRANGFNNYSYGPSGGFAFGPGATGSPNGQGLGPYGDFANAYAAFLLGTPSNAGRNQPYWSPGYTEWQASAHISDRIKLSERLTLNLGARWDVFTPLEPRHTAGVFTYDPTGNRLSPLGVNGVDSVGNMETNWKNVAPRVGIAYRAMSGTVVRAGYGINFFNPALSFFSDSLMTNIAAASGGLPGSFSTAGTLGQQTVPSNTFANAAAALNAPNAAMVFMPRNMKTPYVHTYDFLIEHDLGRYGLIASVGYVGNLGRELPYSREINAVAAGAGEAGQPLNTQFGRTASTIERATGLTSNYNSLQASLRKRFSQNLSFTAAYTYSRALDHGPGGLTPLLNNVNFQSNYGPADWDRTHMFTLSHVWRIPLGADSNHLSTGIIGRILGPWQIDGVFRWVTGTPLTVTADPTLCNCPGNTALASTVVTGTSTSFIPLPTFFGFLPVPVQSLNFAFTQPDAGTQGNLGRNSARGDGFANYDLSLFRSFVVHEGVRVEFRATAFNIANTAHFANPILNVNSASFGQSIGTLPYAPERRLQFGGRIVF